MPKPPRFFISPEQVRGNEIIVSGADMRHIRTVLRKQPGDMLTLLDGLGKEYTVRITAATKSEIITEIVRETKREVRGPRITLAQGLPKADKMDWIVQKATELGVSRIIPLVTERTVVKIKAEEKRVVRWQKIAREAAMQCERADIPVIGQIVSFSDFVLITKPAPQTMLLLPWEEGTQPIKKVLCADQNPENIVVLIGPEGGFSRAEAELAKDRGFQLVSLGPNILRTETAAVAVLSMIAYEYL